MPATAATRARPVAAGDLPAAVVAVFAERWQRCRKMLRRLDRKKVAPEDVHQARVACRRMLAVIDVLLGLCDHKALPRARKLIKRQLRALSPLRDADVQSGHVHELRARFPQLEPFYRALLKHKARLARALRDTVDAPAKLPGKLVRRLEERLCEHLFLEHELYGRTLQAFGVVEQRLRAVRTDRPATLHALRVAVKRYRYSVEAVYPLLAVMGDRAHERLHDWQSRLGEIQDLAVLSARLAKLAGGKLADHAEALTAVRKALADEQHQKIAAVAPALGELRALAPAAPARRRRTPRG